MAKKLPFCHQENVIIFIIRVLKLLFMKISPVPLVFLLLLCLVLVPAQASLAKIVSGAPVFIGERNLDISAPMNGHTVIAWWPAGSDRSGEPQKTVTVPDEGRSYYLDPAVFTGYTGTWYTHDVKPDIPVFILYEPQIDLKVWDVDTGTDVTGQSLPMSANITYRIDTNMYMALDYTKRPDYNPSDSFFTVKLRSPTGMDIPQIYTGNIGGSQTQILKFDSNPLIKSSPYFWKNGAAWDHNAKSTDGSTIYPPGTYTFVAKADLNHMASSYTGTSGIGKTTTGDKTITFIADTYTTSPTIMPSITAPVITGVTTPATPAATIATVTTNTATAKPTATTVAKKTTFTPLPVEIVFAGLGLAALVFAMRRKY